MQLPDLTQVAALEQRSEYWLALRDTWETITDLREGAPTLLKKREKYLPRRPGETPELYQLRLAKFSYTPILSTSIREFTSKLASAPLHISGLPEGDQYWAEWMEAIDGAAMDRSELLNRVFSTLLYYGCICVAVEKPYLGLQPRNKAEEPQVKPYLLFYDPLLVTNSGDGWYLTRQLETGSQPLQKPTQVATWVYWLPDRTVTYQAEVKADSEGYIRAVKVAGKWVNSSLKAAVVPKIREVVHNLGKASLCEAKLEPEDWVGAQAFLKQIQHLQIESAWTDSGTLAGVVQRLYVPPQATPTSDPRVAYDTPDYSEMLFDNQHVLVGSDFKFVESTGAAVGNLSGQLDKIEHQLRSIASMGWQAVAQGALEQSGKSKEVDQAMLQDSLKKYGKSVLQLLQDILQLVAKVAGRPERPTCQGLDTYSTDTLGSMLDASQALDMISPKLPTTALKIWYGKLSSLLTGSVSPEDQKVIQEELEDIFSGQGLDPEDPKDVTKVAAAFGVTDEEALGILEQLASLG